MVGQMQMELGSQCCFQDLAEQRKVGDQVIEVISVQTRHF